MKIKHHPFMDKPVPDLSDLRSDKSSYKDIPIHHSSERCRTVGDWIMCHSYYWHYDPRPPGAMREVFLRETFIHKLGKIDRQLKPLGLRLLVQEGYRPLSVQRFVREHSVLKGLRLENPNLGEEELGRMVEIYAASFDGDLILSPPPHLTGGAVDLIIIHMASGKPVDMGKKTADGKSCLYGMAFPDALEKGHSREFGNAKKLRRLLFWLARDQDIATNPTEWWHLCYGDQMWAWISKKPHAIYGVARSFQK